MGNIIYVPIDFDIFSYVPLTHMLACGKDIISKYLLLFRANFSDILMAIRCDKRARTHTHTVQSEVSASLIRLYKRYILIAYALSSYKHLLCHRTYINITYFGDDDIEIWTVIIFLCYISTRIESTFSPYIYIK